jgi:hypothetical protein
VLEYVGVDFLLSDFFDLTILLVDFAMAHAEHSGLCFDLFFNDLGMPLINSFDAA